MRTHLLTSSIFFLSAFVYADTAAPLQPNNPVTAPISPNNNPHYYETKRIWATQQIAKNEIDQFVKSEKQAVALELRVSESNVDANGPKISGDGNICVDYSIDRSNLPLGDISDVNQSMTKLAQDISEKNDSPIAGTNVSAFHYPRTSDDTPVVRLLTACVSPDKY